MRIKRNCLTLIIDYQERLMPILQDREKFISNSVFFIKGLKVLNIPMLTTEQYPKGLGKTVEPVQNAMGGSMEVYEKTEFSCCDNLEIMEKIKSFDREFVILAGAETHVCMLQTALDLMANDFIPVVISDCTASSSRFEKESALSRLRSHGAVITTAESILFELCRKSGTQEFKELSRLVKERQKQDPAS